jgi:acyl carrier protein
MHPLLQKGKIEDQIMKLLESKGFTADEANLDSRIEDDFGLDSLDKAELVMSLETEFNVTIPDGAAEYFVTLRDVVDYIDRVISQP